jgi:adenylate cyclase
MKLFENSLNDIDSIINKRSQRYKSFDASFSATKNLNEGISKAETGIIPLEQNKVIAKADYSELQGLFGTHKFSFSEPFIGPHPDFAHLQHDQYLSHYAVSMFLDIKGSTDLSKRYDLLQIRQIKDTILTLAIQVCSFFGGHIQRLQGDGIFVYFVRKDMHQNDAIINALNSASLMSFFMKYQLPQYFKDEDIAPPKVRIGIDFGNAEKTIWSYYGLSFCRELTTTSLHTDLAAKLQAKADPNGIKIGDNIVNELDLQAKLVQTVTGEEYIFDKYKQWKFNWETYLQTFDFIKKDTNQNLVFESPNIRLKCLISQSENGQYYEYQQNLYSIPKGYKIKFQLVQNNTPYVKPNSQEIEWTILNTGKEATKNQKLTEIIKEAKNKNECSVNAEFLGHHDMQCKIRKQFGENVNLKYPVFVR